MAKTVLFVHGTGVRKAAFEATAERIGRGLARIAPDVKLLPCLWGDALGASLRMGGVSIPEYVKPAGSIAQDEKNIALWSLLAQDPLFELRELAAVPADEFQPPAVATDKQLLRTAAAGLPSEGSALALLEAYGAAVYWADAANAVLNSGVIGEAIDAARKPFTPLRLAIGRAIVATVQARLAELNMPGLPKAQRDELVDLCLDRLGGREAGGLLDWFSSRLIGLGLNWAMAKARRKREGLYGVAAPTAGDVVLYQARGKAIRDFIESRIRGSGDDVVVVAHSLGGIACVDLLILRDLPQVKALVTVGSQAPFLYEIDALSALPFGEALPDHFPKRWLNFYDCNDLLSYKAGKVFADHAEDVEVASGQPFPYSHSAYWDEQAFWDAFAAVLN